MKCPNCGIFLEGHRGKFSSETLKQILTMYYLEKKSYYAIAKHFKDTHVHTNKMTIKKIVSEYENTWKTFLNVE